MLKCKLCLKKLKSVQELYAHVRHRHTEYEEELKKVDRGEADYGKTKYRIVKKTRLLRKRGII